MEREKNAWTWESITDCLIQEMEENRYEKGEKLPSENQMAVRFGVPRTEIRRVYHRLKELGYLYSLQGQGSFFYGKKEKIPLTLTGYEGFGEKMAALGIPCETRLLKVKRIPYQPILFQVLGVQPEEAVYEFSRLRLLYQKPAAIHTSFLPASLFPQFASDVPHIQSLFQYMREQGFPSPVNTDHQLAVSPLAPEERAYLNIPGYASGLILTSRCVQETAEGPQILGMERVVYRSDSFLFQL